MMSCIFNYYALIGTTFVCDLFKLEVKANLMRPKLKLCQTLKMQIRCRMVFFQTKIPNLGTFRRVLEW
jgi:hypothetical protein